MHATADTIFYGGHVITVDDTSPTAEAVAVKDGKFLAVGTLEEVLKCKGTETKVLDITGQTLMPGFVEPHSHPFYSATHLHHYVNILGVTLPSFSQAVLKMKKAANDTPPGKWIVGYGLDPLLMTDCVRAPTREFLDEEISNQHPLFILASSTHNGFCNTRGFEAAGITANTTNPMGGTFVKNPDGTLHGQVLGCPAIDMIFAVQPRINNSQLEQLVAKQLLSYSEVGITTVAELGVGLDSTPSGDPIDLFHGIGEKPGCPVRLIGYVAHSLTKERLHEFPPTKATAERNTHIVGVKVFSDGSPYPGTMATSEPYLDTKVTRECLAHPCYPNYGRVTYSFEEMIKMMRPAHAQGLQLAIHAHGDRAINQVLDIVESLLRETPRQDHRYRLEHCGQITKPQLKRARKLGVTISYFLDHLHYYGRVLKEDILGPERASRWTPLRSAEEAGHIWSLHSDTPCAPANPLRVLKTATTRQTRPTESYPGEVLGAEETVSLDQAIKAVTVNPAWQLFHEHLIGSIEVGKLADLVVLNKNPYDVMPCDLDQISVLATYKSGKKVYCNSPK